MKIAIVYGNDGTDVRVAKTCSTLVKQGHEVHFIGWDRRPDVQKDSTLPDVTKHVIPHLVPALKGTLSGQLAFTRHAVATLWKLKPDVVHAVNEDNIVRIGWMKPLCFRRIVCDVFDSHLDKHTHRSWPVRAIVNIVCNATRWWSDRLIATDDVRFSFFGRFRSKTIVVGNYPPDPGPELSKKELTGPPKVFVSGTLSKVRGTEAILKAAEKCPGMKIISAGWAADEYTANEFLNHPSVEHLGHVTPRESLEIASECDAVLAMYAPTIRNHILASPNKIYDAASVGRPVIMNSEALVSKWVVDNRVGFACEYEDTEALSGYLNTLLDRRKTLQQYAAHARSVFESGYSWEAMEERLAMMYYELDPNAEVNPEANTIQNRDDETPEQKMAA